MLSEKSISYYQNLKIGEPNSSSYNDKLEDDAIGIVVVNWNSWAETIECLSAISNMASYRGPVVVCDNASTDSSIEYIEAWAKGNLCALSESGHNEVKELVRTALNPLGVPTIIDIDSVGDADISKLKSRLTIIHTGGNLGFGAGSNIGIRFLQRSDNIKWFWLLNCDALPLTTAFVELQARLPLHDRPSICGTTLLEYSNPSLIQSCGAGFNRLLCSMRDNLRGCLTVQLDGYSDVLPVDYPVGASILVNRSFIDAVGHLREDYFLYFEEIDWVMRYGWPSKAFIIVDSKVYHKGGATTGAGSNYRERTLSADYYFLKSRILFARRFGQVTALTVLIVSTVALVRRALLFDVKALKNACRALYAGFRAPL